MSKISIEGIQVSMKRLWILIFLPLLFSCNAPCTSKYDLSPYNCNQCLDLASFSSCIKKNFPVDSSYNKLTDYLVKIGFEKLENPDDTKKNRFYFFWEANDLTPYKVVVIGHYSNELKITELNVS
jgi:hypothetical protein